MDRFIAVLLFLCICSLVWGDDFQSLIETEQAFARHSVEKGTKEAFLTYLAEDGILFRPHPVEGKNWMKDRPASKGTLDWRPSFAGFSRFLGFTTGPYTFRAESGEIGHGHFVTLWRKEQDGSFRAALDTGISHSEQKVEDRVERLHGGPAQPASAMKLEQVEQKFLRQPDSSYFSEKGRLMRDGTPPTIGKENIGRHLKKEECSPIRFEADTDLGYVYGKCAMAYYVRIWERQTTPDWKIVIDVQTEIPTE